jgi:hypothetical protein
MVYGSILGGVGIGTRDFRLTMACSGHPTNDSIALFPSAAFFMPDVWLSLSTTHKSLNSKRSTNSNNTLPSSGRNLLFKHQAATDSNSAHQPSSTELTAGGTCNSLGKTGGRPFQTYITAHKPLQIDTENNIFALNTACDHFSRQFGVLCCSQHLNSKYHFLLLLFILLHHPAARR